MNKTTEVFWETGDHPITGYYKQSGMTINQLTIVMRLCAVGVVVCLTALFIIAIKLLIE